MIRDVFRRFGCGMNKAENGATLKHCEVNGLDFFIYRMGAEKIKRMIPCNKRHPYTENADLLTQKAKALFCLKLKTCRMMLTSLRLLSAEWLLER